MSGLAVFVASKLERIWGIGVFGIGVVIQILIWRAWRVRMDFCADGVRFSRRSQEVFCPWELFVSAGSVFGDNSIYSLLPINPAFVEQVELTEFGQTVAKGREVKTDFLYFDTVASVRMLNRFQLPPELVCSWLRHLAATVSGEHAALAGRAGAEQIPANPDRFGESHDRHLDDVAPVDGNKVTLHLTRLIFPDECCICGSVADSKLTIAAPPRRVPFFLRSQCLQIEIPCCSKCRKTEPFWKFAGFIVAIMMTPVELIALAWVRWQIMAAPWDITSVILFLLECVRISWAVCWGPQILARAKAEHLPLRNSVTFSFRRAEYAEKTAALARQSVG